MGRTNVANNTGLNQVVNPRDPTQEAKEILRNTFQEALDKMSPEDRENLVQLALDATQAEESKEGRWFLTRGFPGFFALVIIFVAIVYFRNDLVEKNLHAVVEVAFNIVWIHFWQHYIAHLRKGMGIKRTLQCLVFIPTSITTLLIVYNATNQRDN